MIQTLLCVTVTLLATRATQGRLHLPTQSLRRRLTTLKCQTDASACMKDTTCTAIVNQEANSPQMAEECLENKLCSQMHACSNPCWTKIAACMWDTACTAVLPKSEEPTHAENRTCAQNQLCHDVLICKKIHVPTTTSSEEWTWRPTNTTAITPWPIVEPGPYDGPNCWFDVEWDVWCSNLDGDSPAAQLRLLSVFASLALLLVV